MFVDLRRKVERRHINADPFDFREQWPSSGADEGGVVLAEPNEDLFFEQSSKSHCRHLP